MKQEYLIEIETDDLLIDISSQIEEKIKEFVVNLDWLSRLFQIKLKSSVYPFHFTQLIFSLKKTSNNLHHKYSKCRYVSD